MEYFLFTVFFSVTTVYVPFNAEVLVRRYKLFKSSNFLQNEDNLGCDYAERKKKGVAYSDRQNGSSIQTNVLAHKLLLFLVRLE
jgi:hypothetical protein